MSEQPDPVRAFLVSEKEPQTLPDRFLRGVVLYTGQEVVPFSPKLFAMPLTALWELRKR